MLGFRAETYPVISVLPVDTELLLMVDQQVSPAKPFSFPTHLISGPALEKILTELCNSFTIKNQSEKS